MGHGAGHVLVDGHALLHRPLHADQADAELVFQEFADRSHAPVAEMVDVVSGSDIPSQLEQVVDRCVEVRSIEHPAVQRRGVCLAVQLDVELHAADSREVVLAAVEEHALEEIPSCFPRRRVAWAELAVNLEQRFVLRLDRVLAQCFRENVAALVGFREDDAEFPDSRARDSQEGFLGHQRIGLAMAQHFAALRVEDVVRVDSLEKIHRRARKPFDSSLLELLEQARIDLASLAAQHPPVDLDVAR